MERAQDQLRGIERVENVEASPIHVSAGGGKGVVGMPEKGGGVCCVAVVVLILAPVDQDGSSTVFSYHTQLR